jgi:hypothetical protein
MVHYARFKARQQWVHDRLVYYFNAIPAPADINFTAQDHLLHVDTLQSLAMLDYQSTVRYTRLEEELTDHQLASMGLISQLALQSPALPTQPILALCRQWFIDVVSTWGTDLLRGAHSVF